MGDKLYGAKCHRCGHLRHDGDCASCSFCVVTAFLRTIKPLGLGMFDPEVRRAVHALRRGEDDPLVDQLRTECQALNLTIQVGAKKWRVIDAQFHTSEGVDSQHLHLTLTPALVVEDADEGSGT